MDRREAIEYVKQAFAVWQSEFCTLDGDWSKETEALDFAVEALNTERPKTTETMMVDGEPMEIDPLSYEVGYTHGQFSERPKGKWKYGNGNGECPFCGHERQLGWDNYCGYCGARMRE